MEFIMPQTEITIQEHNTQDYNDPNKEAKTNFKVTAEDGTRYSYPKNRTDWKLSDIGATRLIIWEEKPPVNAHGKPWKLIQSVILQPDDDIPYGNGANGSAQPSYQPSQPPNDKTLNEIHALYLKCYQLVSTERAFQEFSTEQKGTTATTYFINASRSKQ